MTDSNSNRSAAPVPRGAELAVVGGGPAGLLGAWRAAAAGADVLVLDSPERPAAAQVAAGMIAPVGEASWGGELMLGPAQTSAGLWPGFARELADASGLELPYRRCGALHVALDRDEAAALRRRDPLLEGAGLESEALLGSEARRLEPGLSSAIAGATHAPGEAEVDPRRLLSALRTAAERAGARFAPATVSSIGSDGSLQLDSGRRLDAERVLLAAGAWSGAEGLLPAGRLPIRPVKGEILRLRAEPDAMPCTRIIVGERFYLVPRADGELVLGASAEERGFDLRVTAGAVHELLREAYRALPELAEAELVEMGAGLRPGSPDNAPLFGPIAETAISVATGLYRNGILLSPLLAQGFDAAFAGNAMPAELAGLAPGRFGALAEREAVA